MLYRKQNSIEYHKKQNQIKAFFRKIKNQTEQLIPISYKRKLFFYTVTLQQVEELYVEKIVFYFCKSLL
jgi:hypothetical protein